MTHSTIGAAGLLSLIPAIGASLEVLRLEGNCIAGNSGEPGLRLLLRAVDIAERLRELSLARNNLDEEGAILVSEMLAKHRALTSLDLSSNFIGSRFDGSEFIATTEATRQLALALARNHSLLELRVADNRLRTPTTSKPMLQLVHAAAAHTPTLSFLDLSGNDLREEEASAVPMMLQEVMEKGMRLVLEPLSGTEE